MNLCRSMLLAFFTLLMAGAAQAAVERVVLYPNSMDVSESFTAEVNNGTASFTIPGPAVPDTLQVTTAQNVPIVGISWETLINQNGPAIERLRKELNAAIDRRNELRAAQKAARGGIGYLESVQTKGTPDATAAVRMAETISAELQKQYRALFARAEELEPLQKKIKHLQQQINEAGGRGERRWRVSVTLGANAPTRLNLNATYNIPGSGWSPSYRLDGLPEEKAVAFGFDALVRQNTGSDLKKVETALATTKPRSTVKPPELPEWTIGPAKKQRPVPVQQRAKNAEARIMLDSTAAAAPTARTKTSYTIWELGETTLPAGKQVRLTLETTRWPASFKRMARPSLSPSVFVSADITLDKAPNLPQGPALFLLDGTLVGKRGFELTDNEATLFFGEDPLVSVKRTLVSKQSGEKGFIGKSQTYDWNWKLLCTNGHERDISLVVEEPQPQSRDKDIELETEWSVKPKVEDKKYVWALDIPAGGEREITYTIVLDAPEGMDIDLGWAR